MNSCRYRLADGWLIVFHAVVAFALLADSCVAVEVSPGSYFFFPVEPAEPADEPDSVDLVEYPNAHGSIYVTRSGMVTGQVRSPSDGRIRFRMQLAVDGSGERAARGIRGTIALQYVETTSPRFEVSVLLHADFLLILQRFSFEKLARADSALVGRHRLQLAGHTSTFDASGSATVTVAQSGRTRTVIRPPTGPVLTAGSGFRSKGDFFFESHARRYRPANARSFFERDVVTDNDLRRSAEAFYFAAHGFLSALPGEALFEPATWEWKYSKESYRQGKFSSLSLTLSLGVTDSD